MSQAKKRAHIRGLGQKRRKGQRIANIGTRQQRGTCGALPLFFRAATKRARCGLLCVVRAPAPSFGVRAVFLFFGRGFRTASRNRPAGGPRPMMSASRRSTHSPHHRNDHTEPPVCPFDLFREHPRVFLAPSCGAPSIAPVPRKAKGTTSTQPAGQDPVPSSSITFGDLFRRPLSCAPPPGARRISFHRRPGRHNKNTRGKEEKRPATILRKQLQPHPSQGHVAQSGNSKATVARQRRNDRKHRE